ncbi:MAG: metallophosphoesterase [Oscillospiraceae bacterium]|nr:metallophosphoesterase [Oscillospiraceae bacterium]
MNGIEVFPYLVPGETDAEMLVCWTGNGSADALRVLYGEDDGSGALPETPLSAEVTRTSATLSDAAWRDAFFRAVLTVEPGKRYVYGISENGAAPTVAYPFVAADADRGFSAVFLSDSHIENDRHAAAYETAAEAALRLALTDGHGLDGIFHLGDMVNKLDESPGVMVNNAPIMRSIPTTAVVGNHDALAAITSFFPGAHKDHNTWDYWFVRGGVLFIGLNIRYTNYDRHAIFLRSIPEAAGEHDWTVVLVHYSMRTNGSHGIDRPVFNLWYFLGPIMEELDVDLVISGHDHEYDRAGLMDSSGEAAEPAGTVLEKQPGQMLFVCVPSATGTKFYDHNIKTDVPMAAEALERAPGFVLADFSREEIRFRVVNVQTGEQVDEFTLRRAQTD